MDAGIRWSGSLRGSARTWEKVTPWGDESAIEESLILEWAESVLGPIGDIQSHHVRVGAAGHTRGEERLVFETLRGGTVSVVVEGGDRRAALRELLARAIRYEESGSP